MSLHTSNQKNVLNRPARKKVVKILKIIQFYLYIAFYTFSSYFFLLDC